MKNYATELEKYRQAVKSLDLPLKASDYRTEHQFECLCDWSQLFTLDEFEQWFENHLRNPTMKIEEVPLKEIQGWETDPITGNIFHKSGEFFTVHGVRAIQSSDREVAGGWDQPILKQTGFDGGILGILRQRKNEIPYYLVEAKAEPGNYGIMQISPTLQATFSNLKRAHGGTKPKFAELFEFPQENGANVLYEAWLSEDGGRLFNKRNRGMIIEIAENINIELPDNFIWASMYQLKACLHKNAWVSPHIRGIIAHL